MIREFIAPVLHGFSGNDGEVWHGKSVDEPRIGSVQGDGEAVVVEDFQTFAAGIIRREVARGSVAGPFAECFDSLHFAADEPVSAGFQAGICKSEDGEHDIF